MRLTIEEYGSFLTLAGKSRSEDPFTRVSCCAIGHDNKILGISYNGLKQGEEVPEWMHDEKNRELKTQLFIHAEPNIFSLFKKDECKFLCLNISPCISCCQLLAAWNVPKIIYLQEYEKCDRFKHFCTFHGIEYEELNKKSKGNILNYINDLNNFKELL